MQDLIAGRIDYFCALGAAAMGPLEAGNAKAMALLTSDRSPLFPTLQTSKEQGLPGVDFVLLDGVLLSQGHARRHRPEAL